MDPNTQTREAFTNNLTSVEIPSSADPQWSKTASWLRELLQKIAHHPAMEANLQQTYMTPAASKNKVYFMWDFVGRTMSMAGKVDPKLQNMGKAEKEIWSDVVGRSMMAKQLILDTMPGGLDMMVNMTHPGQTEPKTDFGEEIRALAGRLED
ncbi:hypothetical protein EV356DRAFT_576609 [Viridothelium virens]|uniref:Uncharacterized protein n=1 Tax=Viridothelium virens TaxID=1048519 RepID=A0A6A6HB08_VIRVR|nr:hypothetical protein EV356DRAFT_576609 [Viridothelium virens]